MDDLIRRSDALEKIQGIGMAAIAAYARIKSIPAVDAVEARHGRWIIVKDAFAIDTLKKELEEEENNLLAAICDACHWPYVAGNEDALMKHCDECSICGDLQTLIKKHRTIAASEVMTIAAHEITTRQSDMDKLLEDAGWE